MIVLLALCCLSLASCGESAKPYISEAKSKTVEARAGLDYAEYAVYNPAMSSDSGIEAADVEFATGTFRLLNPTVEKLKGLSDIDYVTLYYNQYGQVIIEIKGR